MLLAAKEGVIQPYRLQHDEVGYGQRTGDAKVLLLKILVETDPMLLGTKVQIELGRRIF